MTPLMVAAQDGKDSIVEVLVSSGANVNAQNDLGETLI